MLPSISSATCARPGLAIGTSAAAWVNVLLMMRALTKRESDNATLQDLNYTYDPVGNVVAIADAAQQGVFFGGNFVNADQLFEYDATYRLTKGEGREHAVLDLLEQHQAVVEGAAGQGQGRHAGQLVAAQAEDRPAT